jgi:predicted permease
MIASLLLALTEAFVLLGFGFLIRKLGYLNDADIGKWSRVLIDFFFPLLS